MAVWERRFNGNHLDCQRLRPPSPAPNLPLRIGLAAALQCGFYVAMFPLARVCSEHEPAVTTPRAACAWL